MVKVKSLALTSNAHLKLCLFVGVTVNSLHPGLVATDIWKNFGPVGRVVAKFITQLFGKVSTCHT
jgi:NAD(P)-dependent dehydrogenase (short-subunit alcohol dehydrogenase family)